MLKSIKKTKTQYIFFVFFTLLCFTSLPSLDSSSDNSASDSTLIQYLIIIAFIAISLFRYGIKRLLQKSINYNFIDFIPIIFLIVWLYGVFVGLINAVPEKYVFRNFGGMIFYVTFYFFYIIPINLKTISKSIFFNSYIGIPIIFYFVYLSLTGNDVRNVGGERVIFCFLQMIIFIPFVIIFGNAFFSIGENKKYIILTSTLSLIVISILCYFTSVVISFSKGMILASFAIILLIILFRIANGMKPKIVLNFFLAIIVFIGILIYFDLFTLLGLLFSNKEVSNATRSLQSEYLIDDLTFLGRGLGSGLTNVNYTRADDAPYAFELTYLNLFHKFGFMAIFLFISYIYTFWKIFKLFGKDPDRNFKGLLCLGLMAYVFPSIGNPFLFSPFAIICHLITLYIIKLDLNNKIHRII